MAQLDFNAEEVEPADFTPLPEGKYPVVVSASEMKPTKENTGSYLELELTVIEGAYNGRKVWARLNLENQSATAVKIARQQLSAICRAVGVLTINDSSQLHNRPLLIHVVCKPRSDGNGITNEVKSYEPLPANPAVSAPTPVAPPASAPSAPPQAAGPGPAPWGRPATT